MPTFLPRDRWRWSPKKATSLVLASLFLGTVATAGTPAERLAQAEWPQWRGPNRDGISPDTGLATDWETNPPKLLWELSGLGSGYASVSLKDGLLYTTGDFGQEQSVVAVDLADPSHPILWKTPIGPAGGIGYPGSRCTPTIDEGKLYVVGTKGAVACLDAKTGGIVWRRHLVEDFGGRMMSGWGYSESPLIDDGKLLVTPGAADAAIVALDKRNGDDIWHAAQPDFWEGKEGDPNGKPGAGYSSIVRSNAGGVPQYVQLVGRGVISVAADTGKFLWGYNRIANRTANIPTPIVRGNLVFCSTGYGTGSALLDVKESGGAFRADEVYFLDARTLQNHHGGMVLVGDHVYCGNGHNQGFPACVELETGELAWPRQRGAGSRSAAVVYADGHVIFRYQDGVVALIEADPEEYRLKGTFEIPDVKDPSWPHPVVAGGQLLLREQDKLYCYELTK